MSKLLKLKKTLTLPEAAKYLSLTLGEEVTETDLLSLALDGHLMLSLNLVNSIKARSAKFVSFQDAEWTVYPIDPSKPNPLSLSYLKSTEDIPVGLKKAISAIPKEDWGNYSYSLSSIKTSEGKFLNVDNAIKNINGLWNLEMIAAGRQNIEHKCHSLSGGGSLKLNNLDGVFLSDGNTIYQLLESGLFPLGEIPQDALIVLRVEELQRFEETFSKSSEKPLTATERNTLLTLIAALCKFDGVDPNARDATSQIVQMTEDLGAPISDDTIRKVLRQIPNALESRRK
jgi:hypothetical protein